MFLNYHTLKIKFIKILTFNFFNENINFFGSYKTILMKEKIINLYDNFSDYQLIKY